MAEFTRVNNEHGDAVAVELKVPAMLASLLPGPADRLAKAKKALLLSLYEQLEQLLHEEFKDADGNGAAGHLRISRDIAIYGRA